MNIDKISIKLTMYFCGNGKMRAADTRPVALIIGRLIQQAL